MSINNASIMQNCPEFYNFFSDRNIKTQIFKWISGVYENTTDCSSANLLSHFTTKCILKHLHEFYIKREGACFDIFNIIQNKEIPITLVL